MRRFLAAAALFITPLGGTAGHAQTVYPDRPGGDPRGRAFRLQGRVRETRRMKPISRSR